MYHALICISIIYHKIDFLFIDDMIYFSFGINMRIWSLNYRHIWLRQNTE